MPTPPGWPEAVAVTENRMAVTMDRLAAAHPHLAERLRALGQDAREQSATMRRRAEQTARTRSLTRPGEGQADGQVALRPDAAGQDRGSRLAGDIANRLFSVGLSLQGARSMAASGFAGDRVAAAADEIDRIIGMIRDEVFAAPERPDASHRPGAEAGGSQAHLTQLAVPQDRERIAADLHDGPARIHTASP